MPQGMACIITGALLNSDPPLQTAAVPNRSEPRRPAGLECGPSQLHSNTDSPPARPTGEQEEGERPATAPTRSNQGGWPLGLAWPGLG